MSGILVDTCVWSLALRGSSVRETSIAEQLSQLIDENRVKISIGAIRQWNYYRAIQYFYKVMTNSAKNC